MAGPGDRAARHPRRARTSTSPSTAPTERRRAAAQQPRVGGQRGGQHRHLRRCTTSREVGLITDLGSAGPAAGCSTTGQLGDYLADVRGYARPGPRRRSDGVLPVAGARVDADRRARRARHAQPAAAGRGASARHRRRTALALVLDTATWRDGPGRRRPSPDTRRARTRRGCCGRPAGRRASCAAATRSPRRRRRRCSLRAAPPAARPACRRREAAMTATATRPRGRPRRRRPRSAIAAPRSDVRRTLLALLACALGVVPLCELFTDSGWLRRRLADHARRHRPGGGAAPARRPASAARSGSAWCCSSPGSRSRFLRQHAVFGFLPLRGTWHDVGTLLTRCTTRRPTTSAPVHPTVAIRLALCALLGLVAALVDLLAVVGRRGALAGIPLLIVFTRVRRGAARSRCCGCCSRSRRSAS